MNCCEMENGPINGNTGVKIALSFCSIFFSSSPYTAFPSRLFIPLFHSKLIDLNRSENLFSSLRNQKFQLNRFVLIRCMNTARQKKIY